MVKSRPKPGGKLSLKFPLDQINATSSWHVCKTCDETKKENFIRGLMCESCHLNRSLIVEMIFVVVFFNSSCEINFWAPSRLRKGWVISSKTCTAFLVVFLTCQKKKGKLTFKIRCQFQHSTNWQQKWHDTQISKELRTPGKNYRGPVRPFSKKIPLVLFETS